MAQALAFTRTHRALEALRVVLVAGCALALIAADAALPGLSL